MSLLQRLNAFDLPAIDCMEAYQVLKQHIDPNTPRYEISFGDLSSRVIPGLLKANIYTPQMKGFIQEVKEHLYAHGHRELRDILTAQEHKLIGSTPHFADAHYVPHGIVAGKLSVREVQYARKLKLFIPILPYFCEVSQEQEIALFPIEYMLPVKLEELDENGATKQDARLMDTKLNPMPTSYSDLFPYRRK